MTIVRSSFLKNSVLNFLSTQKRKAGVFTFLRFEELHVFRKVPFSWRISVDGRPNRRSKVSFSWRISVDQIPPT